MPGARTISSGGGGSVGGGARLGSQPVKNETNTTEHSNENSFLTGGFVTIIFAKIEFPSPATIKRHSSLYNSYNNRYRGGVCPGVFIQAVINLIENANVIAHNGTIKSSDRFINRNRNNMITEFFSSGMMLCSKFDLIIAINAFILKIRKTKA